MDDRTEFIDALTALFDRLPRRNVQDEEHTHCCGFSLDYGRQTQSGCGHKWKHRMSDFSDQESYDQGHICPKCGKGPWRWKLDSETLAEYDRRRAAQV